MNVLPHTRARRFFCLPFVESHSSEWWFSYLALLSVSVCDLLSLWIVVKCPDILRAVDAPGEGKRELFVRISDVLRPYMAVGDILMCLQRCDFIL